MKNNLFYGGIYFLVLVWSATNPADYFTWWLEAVPALIALPLLYLSRNRFPLTSLGYVLVLIHCCILFIGAHYTYAQVPLFDSIAQWMGSERNNYDKLGHFAQGFMPALLAREIMLRQQAVKPGAWCAFLVICFVMAFSAFYELLEWWVALATGEEAEAFLGTQGYMWDTQSDMLFALIGAVVALWLLSSYQDKQLARLAPRS